VGFGVDLGSDVAFYYTALAALAAGSMACIGSRIRASVA